MPGTCPTCKATSKPRGENRSAPFCGPKCKLADLHNWLDEKYAVPDRSSEFPLHDSEWVEPSDDGVAT